MRYFLQFSIVLALVSSIPAAAQPVRLAADFGVDQAQIEVRDLRTDKAEVAIQAALAEMTAMLALAEAPDSPRVKLHEAPPGELFDLDDQFAALLARTQQFCMWSSGAFGPLAGRLAEVRMAMEEGRGVEPSRIGEALASANCANVAVRVKPDEVPRTEVASTGAVRVSNSPIETTSVASPDSATAADLEAALAEGSRIDLRGWLRGFAIDSAARVLTEHGAGNFWIELGPVRRAMGKGPDGAGWPVVLSFPGVETPIASVYLQDQAMAVTMPLQPPNDRDPILVDQRNGREASGVVAVAVVTTLALDAEALATTTTILGLNEGKMRLASLKPLPAAIVLLGDGSGPPVRADFRWLELRQIERPRRFP